MLIGWNDIKYNTKPTADKKIKRLKNIIFLDTHMSEIGDNCQDYFRDIFGDKQLSRFLCRRISQNLPMRRLSFIYIISTVEFIFYFLARGLGVKVKGRVEKQDCNEQ